VKPEVTSRHPILGPHFCIDLYYSMVVFRVFFLGYVSDRASFAITKTEAYKKNFEQKTLEYYDFITPRNGICNFEGVESLKLCLSTRARFATFIQELLLLGEYFYILASCFL
jgi:hypothetical protein